MALPFNDQAAFLIQVSRATGIDPRVLVAWMYQEGAFSGKETGKYNYLNIMGSNGPASYPSETAGAAATVAVIHQQNMAAILNTAQAKPTPEEQIKAISFSPWDKDHYGGSGGVNLRNTYNSIFKGTGESINSAYRPPSYAQTVVDHVLHISPGGNVGGLPPSVGNVAPVPAITGAFSSIGDFFKWLGGNWDRVLFVAGGGILLILAIIIFAKQQQSNMFTFSKGGE